jgi:hypothetical protein
MSLAEQVESLRRQLVILFSFSLSIFEKSTAKIVLQKSRIVAVPTTVTSFSKLQGRIRIDGKDYTSLDLIKKELSTTPALVLCLRVHSTERSWIADLNVSLVYRRFSALNNLWRWMRTEKESLVITPRRREEHFLFQNFFEILRKHRVSLNVGAIIHKIVG